MPGRARPVVVVGDPVLHTRTEPVTEFDGELAQLIDDLFATMYVAEGVGPGRHPDRRQPGGVRLRLPGRRGRPAQGPCRQPPDVATAGPEEKREEGCLSVPGPYATLGRPYSVTIAGQDLTGQPIELTGTGFLARCYLHETEHLAGTLYIDHLNRRRRSRVLEAIEPFPWNGPLPEVSSI